MVSTWKPHGVHMETTCYPHANHVVSTWKPCGVNMVIMLCQHENNMVSTWYMGHHVVSVHTSGHNVVTTLTPHGFQVDTTWFPCEYHVVSMCTTCGFQVDNTWIQMWTLNDFHMKTTLFSCGHPHGFHMDTMWFLWTPHASTWTQHGCHVDIMWFHVYIM